MTQLAAYFECFDCHGEVVLFPHSHVHLTVLASTQLVLHGDICALHLPFVMDGRHAVHCGLVAFGRWVVKGGDEAISDGRVVVDKLSQGGEAAFRCHIHLRGGRGATEVGEFENINPKEQQQTTALISVQQTLLNLSIRGRVDPVVVDPPLIAKRDGQLSRAALALPD